MAQRVSNAELFSRCYASTNRVADELAPLATAGDLTLDQIKRIRNLLREAYCSAQELKQRMKIKNEN